MLFVRRLRKPAWRPVRGILFSFMASSAFYPIIYACFMHGYSQMDVEAGATRYAVTVLVYLSAVTIYGVSRLERNTYTYTKDHKSNVFLRQEYPKRGDRDGLTRGATHIRFSTCSWLLVSRSIFRHSQKHLIMLTE